MINYRITFVAVAMSIFAVFLLAACSDEDSSSSDTAVVSSSNTLQTVIDRGVLKLSLIHI